MLRFRAPQHRALNLNAPQKSSEKVKENDEFTKRRYWSG
jgi:hypothetical protein